MSKYTIFWRIAMILGLFCSLLGEGIGNVVAQEGQNFEITLKSFGYGDYVLRGPFSETYYYFALPSDWDLKQGSYFLLDLDYIFAKEEAGILASTEVWLNYKLLYSEAVTTSGLRQIRVDIPYNTLRSFDSGLLNELQISFSVNAECEEAQFISTVVKASSVLNVSYAAKAMPVDLSLYPIPIYQSRSFRPSGVRFILPPEPSSADVEAATMIASRLGKISANSLPMSVTLSSGFSPPAQLNEHLFIIGCPEEQPLLTTLDLPFLLRERQLLLDSQMPATVVAGKPFSYTLSVENLDESRTVWLEDRLPKGTAWLFCSELAQCELRAPDRLRWSIGVLQKGEKISTTVHVQVDEAWALGQALEHTAILMDDQDNVINVETLATVVSETYSVRSSTTTSTTASPFFFLGSSKVQTPTFGVSEGYTLTSFSQSDYVAPETDGVLQEIVSPWSTRHVVVAVSGLDDRALLKAARALSSKSYISNAGKNYEFVQEFKPISETQGLVENITFASLGYQDSVVRSLLYGMAEYSFELPWGWDVTEDAYVALHFSHGMTTEDLSAALEVQLNYIPIYSLQLNQKNASDTWVKVPLPKSPMEYGTNWLGIRIVFDVDLCLDARDDQAWLTLYENSIFHLPRERESLNLDLENYPQPFIGQSGLQDLVFVLSDPVVLSEVEQTVRLAARLSYAAGGDEFAPKVIVGGAPATEKWPGYNLIVLGRPKTNPYIMALNEVLPQPFYPNTNELWQRVGNVVYRLAPGLNVGLVQVLYSPWDTNQAVLVVTGTTAKGVSSALKALGGDSNQELKGNLMLIQDTGIQTLDTRQYTEENLTEIMEALVPMVTPTVTATSVATPMPTVVLTPTATPRFIYDFPVTVSPEDIESGRPIWLSPLLFVSIISVLIILIIILRQYRT